MRAMADNRVVLGKKGESSMVPIQWTAECPDGIDDLETAEELGAKWEGEELVTYDLEAMKELLVYYEEDAYLPDND
jgi:hypothetical protein